MSLSSNPFPIKSIIKQSTYCLFSALVLMACNKKSATEPVKINNDNTNINAFSENITTEIDNNIRSIFQDQKGNYWFGTNGAGVFRYDGKKIFQFTEKDGLINNQVQTIQEDPSGAIWFGTGLFGVSRFNGHHFTTFSNIPNSQLHSANDWKIETNDLWFNAGGGVYHYTGNSFVYLPLAKTISESGSSPNSSHNLSQYAVYCILKDKKGNLWFGTQAQGVCRYDGKSFTWFTEKGLEGPAVLGLFEDNQGNIWMGNNGAGLFRYDGKSLINLTMEKGLDNKEFRISGKSDPNSLARIYSINQDNHGDLWIGTVDAGVWRYDGNNFTNYNTKDGLKSKAVNTIYKDRKGKLWFGTDQDGVFQFDGKSFTKFSF